MVWSNKPRLLRITISLRNSMVVVIGNRMVYAETVVNCLMKSYCASINTRSDPFHGACNEGQ